MKVGIIGSGDVAKSLASGFLKHGHDVVIGTRDSAKLKDWAAQNSGARVGSFRDAAQFGQLIVLAVKGSAAMEALRQAGISSLAGKPVIDTTNPIAEAPPQNGVLKFFTTLDESLMERLQREFPDAHFVKAFNSVGNASMVDPQFEGGRPTMFICGNDDGAKKTVRTILHQLTFIYLSSYLLVGGLGLLVVPELTLRLLLSNGSYGDVMPRLVGVFMLALGGVILQFVRAPW